MSLVIVTSQRGERNVTRRDVLRTSGGAVGLSGIVGANDGGGLRDPLCPDASVEPEMRKCEGSNVADCADDHPLTEELQADVRNALETHYPTVGSLIDRGFVPYFDFLRAGGSEGWSHWLNPEFIGDDTIMDPEHPASVLVDNKWWRPLGVMFVAVRDGTPVEDPPAVYETYGEGGEKRCTPWHYHVGLPGRYAWWKFRNLYADDHSLEDLRLPCRTPCMMHVWSFENPNGVYAHDAPSRGDRGGPPAEPAGFDTEADPGEDELGWRFLPDGLARDSL